MLHLIMDDTPHTFQNFCGSCLNIQFKPYATSKMELFVTKNNNSWELMLIVVTESSELNVTGLLDLTLKHIDNFLYPAFAEFEEVNAGWA